MKKLFSALASLSLLLPLTGCQTTGGGSNSLAQYSAARAQMHEAIANEPPGNYFVARRYYKQDYKFWGYIRQPRQPWSSAKLVVLNEQNKLAPDREQGTLGIDNGVEYRLHGSFSGETVYEPASNGFYPEFVLRGYEELDRTPVPIFSSQSAAMDPARRVILNPQ